MAKRRYTKVEEEIIQILEEKDREPGWHQLRSRLPHIERPRVPHRLSHSRVGGEGLTWLGLTFGIALAAVLVSRASHLLGGLLAIAAIIVFLSPIVLNRRSRGTLSGAPRRWRGRDIDLPPSGGGLSGDLRRRLWEYRRRRR